MSIERPPILDEVIENEKEPYREDLLGFSIRLYFGGNALNPDAALSPVEINAAVPQDEYELLDFTSKKERVQAWKDKNIGFDEKLSQWTNNLAQLFGENQVFFNSQIGQEWSTLFAQLGINTHNVTQADAENLYQRYFGNRNELSGVKRFVSEIHLIHLTDEGLVNLDLLEKNMQAIEWISHIFGDESSEIISCFTNIKVRAQDPNERTILFENSFSSDNSSINSLTPRQNSLLHTLWENKLELERQSYSPRPPKPQVEPLIVPEKKLSSEEVAEKILDYKTGKSTGEQIDLGYPFIQFAQNVLRSAPEDQRFSYEKPTIVLSDVAYSMLLKILKSSNDKDKELAFVIRGLRSNVQGKNVFIGGLVVPAMDFNNNTFRKSVILVPELADMLSLELARKTGLATYFELFGGGRDEKGDLLCVGHTHQEHLGESVRANPSSEDYEQVITTLSDKHSDTPFVWGVFTYANNKLYSKILSSQLENGKLVNNEINFITESSL